LALGKDFFVDSKQSAAALSPLTLSISPHSHPSLAASPPGRRLVARTPPGRCRTVPPFSRRPAPPRHPQAARPSPPSSRRHGRRPPCHPHVVTVAAPPRHPHAAPPLPGKGHIYLFIYMCACGIFISRIKCMWYIVLFVSI
jgi:hypothetical protein